MHVLIQTNRSAFYPIESILELQEFTQFIKLSLNWVICYRQPHQTLSNTLLNTIDSIVNCPNSRAPGTIKLINSERHLLCRFLSAVLFSSSLQQFFSSVLLRNSWQNLPFAAFDPSGSQHFGKRWTCGERRCNIYYAANFLLLIFFFRLYSSIMCSIRCSYCAENASGL